MPQNINTNLTSLVGLRQLSQTQTNLNRILEKVAAGNRINSARDDAAGLAIANRFSAQIAFDNSLRRHARTTGCNHRDNRI